MTDDLHVVLDRFVDDATAYVTGPRSAEEVAEAEAELGLAFPPSYREYLLRLGYASRGGVEVYGLVAPERKRTGIPDVVWVTRRARADDGAPANYVLISEDGTGSYYVLDTGAAREDGECPVLLWHPGPGIQEPVAESFRDFFLREMAPASD